MDIDEFFRANYNRMVGYGSGFFNPADVEEMVVDVIMRHFDEYAVRVLDGPKKWDTVRAWMNRRVLYNLGSEWLKVKTAQRVNEQFAKPLGVDPVCLDDPEAIMCLRQRIPAVHPILVDYEPCRKGQGRTEAAGARAVANNSADKTRFCREKRKFLDALSS